MDGVQQIELMRKVNKYGNTLIAWQAIIIEAIKQNDMKLLHKLKIPEGFTQGDYDEREVNRIMDNLNVASIPIVIDSGMPDDEIHFTNGTGYAERAARITNVKADNS
jgi:hypothetical protein